MKMKNKIKKKRNIFFVLGTDRIDRSAIIIVIAERVIVKVKTERVIIKVIVI